MSPCWRYVKNADSFCLSLFFVRGKPVIGVEAKYSMKFVGFAIHIEQIIFLVHLYGEILWQEQTNTYTYKTHDLQHAQPLFIFHIHLKGVLVLNWKIIISWRNMIPWASISNLVDIGPLEEADMRNRKENGSFVCVCVLPYLFIYFYNVSIFYCFWGSLRGCPFRNKFCHMQTHSNVLIFVFLLTDCIGTLVTLRGRLFRVKVRNS